MRRHLTENFALPSVSVRIGWSCAAPRPMRRCWRNMAISTSPLIPFPFSGGLTSCEAMWMGVPVVTLPGTGAPSRQTLEFLQALGLPEWAAASPKDYVRIATTLAADGDALAKWRRELGRAWRHHHFAMALPSPGGWKRPTVTCGAPGATATIPCRLPPYRHPAHSSMSAAVRL